MTADERDKLMLFLIERHEEVIAEINMLKDAQLRISSQLEKLTKVVFGLAQQTSEIRSMLEKEEKPDEGDWLTALPRIPQRR